MNGEGLRVVLWLSGCNHHCYKCQNPITWDENDGLIFDDSVKEELFNKLSKNYISGITFSGGDPLHKANLDGVLKLINEIHVMFPNKTIWLYTGYDVEDLLFSDCEYEESYLDFMRKMIISKCDVVVDGKYIDSKRDVTLHWKGSSNQKVIDVKKSLKENKIVLHCE